MIPTPKELLPAARDLINELGFSCTRNMENIVVEKFQSVIADAGETRLNLVTLLLEAQAFLNTHKGEDTEDLNMLLVRISEAVVSPAIPCPFCGSAALLIHGDRWSCSKGLDCPAGSRLSSLEVWNTRTIAFKQ